MKKIILAGILFLALIFLALKCSPNPHEEAHDLHLLDKIRQHQTLLNYDLLTDEGLDTAQLLSVHANVPMVAKFFTEKRTLDLTSFPCANCHSKSLKELKANQGPEYRKAHWDIHLSHADENAMNCTTCHAENNMNQLTTLTGKMLSLDESFKLCGQCHSTQFKDWQGGAHGKQLNGWKPPRVAKTCVSCHDPHKPAFPNRFPARLNTNQLSE